MGDATIVKGNGKILIQQYSEWRGSFQKVVYFVKDTLLVHLATKYGLRFVIEDFEQNAKIMSADEGNKLIEDLREAYKKNGLENLDLETMCPSFSKDIGTNIIEMVYRGRNILLYFTPLSEINDLCEFVYILDLDNQEVAFLTKCKVRKAVTYACPQVTEHIKMECLAKLSFEEIKKKSITTIMEEVNKNLIRSYNRRNKK